MADRYQAGMRVKHIWKCIKFEPPGIGIEIDPSYSHAAIGGDSEPWRDVGIMVEPGYHQLVARLPVARQCPRSRDGERRHIRPEGNLVGRAAKQVGHSRPRGLGRSISSLRGSERAPAVGSAAFEMCCHCGDRRCANLSAAGAI